MVGKLNVELATGRGKIDPELFAPGSSLEELFSRLNLIPVGYTREQVERALGDWPTSVAEAFKAALRTALRDQPPDGNITVVWEASYDYALHVTQSLPWHDRATGITSPGGVTITMHSRYAFDRHPARKGVRPRN